MWSMFQPSLLTGNKIVKHFSTKIIGLKDILNGVSHDRPFLFKFHKLPLLPEENHSDAFLRVENNVAGFIGV